MALGQEAALDFDSAVPLIYPQGTVLFQDNDEYYEAVASYLGFWNTFLDAIDGSYCTYSAYNETGNCNVDACFDPAYPDPTPGGYKGQLQCGVYQPTNVISISYGTIEAALPDYYVKRQCNEWMKLGLQGTTVVMASGDSGVGGKVCNGASRKVFDPSFAVTCPYVLAVGSTEWNRFANASGTEQPNEPLQEVATRRFGSGGGFSNVFPMPSYQSDAVSAYLDQVESSLPFAGYDEYVQDGNFSSVTSGLYHRGGRAFPDLSAVGDRQVIYNNGSWWLIGGSSLSTPVVASMLNLINEERLAVGKSTLGFIHPILVSCSPTRISHLPSPICCPHPYFLTLLSLVWTSRGIHRHHRRQQPRLQLHRLPGSQGLGPRDRSWDTHLPQAPRLAVQCVMGQGNSKASTVQNVYVYVVD